MSDFKFLAWPTEYRVITQHFGANPQNYAQFGLPGHDGADIRAPHGSKVFAVADGRVFKVHTNPNSHNYGIHIRIAHQEGYRTVYAHLQKSAVQVGDVVQAGQIIGRADNTGNSFGSHLHITLKKEGARQGNWPYNIIDPTPFLLPLMGWQKPAPPFVSGWVLTAAISQSGDLAQANAGGVTLRISQTRSYPLPEGSMMIVLGDGRAGFTPVQVPRAALGLDTGDIPSQPAPEPPPTVTTINGWAWEPFLRPVGRQAIVNTAQGVNLRAKPDRNATNIGIVKAGSAVTLLARAANGYLPIRVRRADFLGPVNLPLGPPPPPADVLGALPKDVYLGWTQTNHLQPFGAYAIIRHQGVHLRARPDESSEYVGTIKGDATVTLAGPGQNNHSPILVNKADFFRLIEPTPEILRPAPFPDERPPLLPLPLPIHDTTPGWALHSEVAVNEDEGTVGRYGATLRQTPQRNGRAIGLIPANSAIIVTAPPSGEFVPVRVDDAIIQPPAEDAPVDPGLLGPARIGLHASADPDIGEAEFREFGDMRPGMIKVLTHHKTEDVARLAQEHPDAKWVVRAFLSFGGRNVSPGQFLAWTRPEVERLLTALPGKDVVVELHNEPNLRAEGLYASWQNGTEFGRWWLELLDQYRRALPGVRFIYPGLSPGSSVTNTKLDHIQFVEASREAVAAADGLGVHIYWSNVYPMARALDVLDDAISRFRFKPIWITEASHNKGGVTAVQKGQQYLQFWQEIQKRPVVQGVTFFVASAIDPTFAEEIWVGRGIGRVVGMR